MSSFLRRWSERKSRESVPTPTPEKVIVEPPLAPAEPDPAPEELAAKIAALPALEEIGADTDIRPFLQDFVPAALRKAAMRRAWSADPIISTHLDVARDYAWEFNTGEMPVGFARSLTPDAVQKSLDTIGEIGRKISEALEASPESSENSPASLEKVPEDLASDAVASRAEIELEPYTTPELPEDKEEVSASSFILPRRHGSALPS